MPSLQTRNSISTPTVAHCLFRYVTCIHNLGLYERGLTYFNTIRWRSSETRLHPSSSTALLGRGVARPTRLTGGNSCRGSRRRWPPMTSLSIRTSQRHRCTRDGIRRSKVNTVKIPCGRCGSTTIATNIGYSGFIPTCRSTLDWKTSVCPLIAKKVGCTSTRRSGFKTLTACCWDSGGITLRSYLANHQSTIMTVVKSIECISLLITKWLGAYW